MNVWSSLAVKYCSPDELRGKCPITGKYLRPNFVTLRLQAEELRTKAHTLKRSFGRFPLTSRQPPSGWTIRTIQTAHARSTVYMKPSRNGKRKMSSFIDRIMSFVSPEARAGSAGTRSPNFAKPGAGFASA